MIKPLHSGQQYGEEVKYNCNLFPDNDEERNKYGRVKNLHWKKKYVRAISWEEGRNNFGHVYALTAID